MKAVRFSAFGPPDVLELAQLPDPHPAPGEVRIVVKAAGINASDWKKRWGQLDPQLPQTLGYEAAGIVDELGEGVTAVGLGERVFGFCSGGAAQAELATLSHYAPIPAGLSFEEVAALPAALETAARVLRQLQVRAGETLFINGASGNIGLAAVQLALARGVRVIGSASPAKHELLRSLGAEPVAYGEGMTQRIRALVPGGVTWAFDVAGNGILPELLALVGGDTGRVITVADSGAARYGVHFSRGEDGRALEVLWQLDKLVKAGKFVPPAVQVFALDDVAQAHHVGEAGLATGKLILVP